MPGQMFMNLQQMQRHVSKVNSNTDLSAELEKIASDKGFVISDNEGSGNCMFYALSEQLNLVKGIKISHGELRQSIVQYLRKNPKKVSLIMWNAFSQATCKDFLINPGTNRDSVGLGSGGKGKTSTEPPLSGHQRATKIWPC